MPRSVAGDGSSDPGLGVVGRPKRWGRRSVSPGPLRVAHFTTVDYSLQYLLFPQLLAVIAEGGSVVGISASGPCVAELERAGVRHVPLASSTRSMNLVADVRAAAELWRILRRERFHVLHTHTPKPGFYGRILGRLAGVPAVVNTVHGLYATEDDPLVRRLAVYLMEAVAVRFADAELVQNPEDVALLSRWHIAPRARLLGNGVNLTRFDPSRFDDEQRRQIRATLGAGPGDVLIGTVGRLVAEKGFPELFSAFAGLGSGYRLVVVGPEDPQKPDALPRQLVDDARAGGVRFLGHRDDVDALYAAMDIFVLASHREGFPRAAMEAAAMGLPVIATDIRGCRQVVEAGQTGLLVPVDDPRALTEAIRAIGEDGDRRRHMGEAGRRRALAEFDEREVVRKVMATYREVLGPS